MDNEKEKLSVEIQKLQRQDLWRFVKAFFHHQARNSTSHTEGPPDKKRVIETSFHKLMKNWSDHLYQIKVNGKFAGIVTICDFFYNDQIKDYEIDKSHISYAVLSKFRRRGVASKAVALILEQYRINGKNQIIYAQAKNDNLASIRVMLKNGFIVQKESPYIQAYLEILK